MLTNSIVSFSSSCSSAFFFGFLSSTFPLLADFVLLGFEGPAWALKWTAMVFGDFSVSLAQNSVPKVQ